jgi:NADH pyrophosphatase NudC (nudix superfamily)
MGWSHICMVGFMASYVGGQLCLDPDEIAEAVWFSEALLPDALLELRA